MTETIAYIRNSLKDINPPGEAQARVRLIMERVCGLSTHQLLLGKGKELSEVYFRCTTKVVSSEKVILHFS